MSVMFEASYKPPSDPAREQTIDESVRQFGGQRTFREEPLSLAMGPISLTYEFGDWVPARQAADALRAIGMHVEGPTSY